jgi:RNA polymerase sigma-70 factor, ECF subfamily
VPADLNAPTSWPAAQRKSVLHFRTRLEKKNRDELVREALTKLSPEHREIIDLVYYHEKSVEECAQILAIPAATVKTRMFYARKKLAELVERA